MNSSIRDFLEIPEVMIALRDAWLDSNPGIIGGHEEGGFFVVDETGQYTCLRWPMGSQKRIVPPPHENCRSGEKAIIVSFHTHPNLGPNFLQEPSDQDRHVVRSDPDLKGDDYLGELVVSNNRIYLVDPTGSAHDIGATSVILHMT